MSFFILYYNIIKSKNKTAMANTSEVIDKDDKKFYACCQKIFDPTFPIFELGEREIGNGAIVVDIYDKQEDTIHTNCMLQIVRGQAFLQIDQEPPIEYMKGWIDAITPRYWLTNTNYDC